MCNDYDTRTGKLWDVKSATQTYLQEQYDKNDYDVERQAVIKRIAERMGVELEE